ncbi:MAG: LSM domain-containing protein [Promethearchaeota archaeon]
MERNVQQKSRRPIDYLKDSINKTVLIKVKRNRLFRAILLSFDEHLNLYVKGCSQIFEYQTEDGQIKEEIEELGSIVIRGDNIIFINLADEK